MAEKYSTTKISSFVDLLSNALRDGKNIPTILSIINDSIPIMKVEKRMRDNNLNSTFSLKRINYRVIAKIESVEPNCDKGHKLYTARILEIESGKCPFNIGDTLPITEWELSITGKLIPEKEG